MIKKNQFVNYIMHISNLFLTFSYNISHSYKRQQESKERKKLITANYNKKARDRKQKTADESVYTVRESSTDDT